MEDIIDQWRQGFREKQKDREGKKRSTGVELKFPAVQKDGKAIDFADVISLWQFMGEKGWQIIEDPQFNHPVGVRRSKKPYDDLMGTETGYCKLELSLGYEEDLFALSRKVEEIAELLHEFSWERGVNFLGLGIQPLTPPDEHLMMKKSRNLFWNEVFGNKKVSLFTITATNQVHVDVSEDEAADAVNVFNALSGPQIALNANSTVWKGKVDTEHKAVSEQFWDEWLPGDDRVGMPPRRFKDLEDYVYTLASFRPVYIMRDGQYLGIGHYDSFLNYWEDGTEARAVTEDGEVVKVMPEIEDVDLHHTFCWQDARISGYYTLENRVNCQQPPGELMVVAALTLGLMEELNSAKVIVDSFEWDEFCRAREDAIHRGLKARLGEDSIADICQEIVAIAEEGLKKRGLGEEVFLQPLKERLAEERCPADYVRDIYQKDGIKGLLTHYTV